MHVIPPFEEQPLPAWKRAVLKVGSSLLADAGRGLSPRHALGLAQFVSASIGAGREGIARVLALPSKPTAVICGTDLLAAGALAGRRRRAWAAGGPHAAPRGRRGAGLTGRR